MSRVASSKTAKIWAERIAQCEQTNAPVAQFCQSINCSPTSFYQWKRKLAAKPQTSAFLRVSTSEPIDMRKSFDGLYGIIKSDLNRDVRDGGLFMFLNQRLNRLKILYWDTDGIAIWMKRLEQGCFQRPLRCADGKHVIITHAELQCILSGVDLSSVRKRKRYVAPSTSVA